MKASEWIDALKRARSWDSDYRVAKELDISEAAISRYRSKPDSTMDDVVATQVAKALDLEPHIIVIDQVAERSPVEAVRNEFRAMFERVTRRKKVPRVGGGALVDITSATSAEGGEPDRCAPKIRIVSSVPQRRGALLQQLHQAVVTLAWAFNPDALRRGPAGGI